MSEVEFLVPRAPESPQPAPDDPPAAPGLLRRHLPTTAATALLATAAVLAALAPFRSLYTLRFNGGFVLGLDGWGRVAAARDGVDSLTHGPRFGVPVVVAGAACGVLALWIAVQAWRGVAVAPTIAGRVVPAIGLVAGGVMVGSAVSAWSYYAAFRDSTVQQNHVGLTDGSIAQSIGADVQAGGFWPLAAVGGICAMVGALAAAAPPGPAAMPARPLPEPVVEEEPRDLDGPTVVADPVVRTDGDEELLGS